MTAIREVTIRLCAKNVMTTPVITVCPDTSVKDVATLMLTHHISGLPVVTSDGEMVGIITETDLLYKESGSPHTGARVLTEFLQFGKMAAAAKKAGGLVAGVVYLGGEVDRWSEKELAERWTRRWME